MMNCVVTSRPSATQKAVTNSANITRTSGELRLMLRAIGLRPWVIEAAFNQLTFVPAGNYLSGNHRDFRDEGKENGRAKNRVAPIQLVRFLCRKYWSR